MVKKIVLKIGLLFLILLLLNFIYANWLYEKDIQKNAKIINLVRSVPNNADVIYVGESSNTSFRGDDVDKRSIAAFVDDFYPKLNVYDITKPASHAGIYKELLANIADSNKVKTIVVTLNLRSFNAQWIYSNLETSLQKSIVLIKPYPPLFNRFLLSFKGYDIKTEQEREEQFKRKWKKDKFNLPYDFEFENVKEWDGYMWKNGIKNADGSKNQELSELACHYIKAYAFQIDTIHNPRIKDFNDIVKLAKKRNWNLVFNLLAENTQKAAKLVGKDLTYMMNENAKILENYYTSKGVMVVNNLNQINDHQFIDQNWTTEHYAEKGRRIIAKNVAEGLKLWHGDFFEEVKHIDTYQTMFFNNCDDNVVWGQMQSITSRMAHSGKKSSEVGLGNDFSITFEYPLKIIPDSVKNMLNIDFWIFQNSLNHNAKMIVQANGEGFEYYWQGFDIKKETKSIKTWTKISVEIAIPDSIKQADLMKIYVYNPAKEKIFIDDFRVTIVP